MKKLLLILIALPMIGFGQVNIPDANFKASLVGNSVINTNGDTEIQVSEAAAFGGGINCGSLGISDLTGIESFTALTVLACYDNQLTSLDVSNNAALTQLACYDNQLTSLDVSNNAALTYLNFQMNQLTSLDVSQNTALVVLYCDNNLLTSLDVSQNTALTILWCSANQLTSLNVRNGNNINWNWEFCGGYYDFSSQNNPNLYCIEVDDVAWSTVNIIMIDAQHYFSNNCSGTGIQEHSTNKELLKVTDLLGRETKQTNQPLLYIYDDGTVEKRIVIE